MIKHLNLGTNARSWHDLPAVEVISAWQKETGAVWLRTKTGRPHSRYRLCETDGINQFSWINIGQVIGLRN